MTAVLIQWAVLTVLLSGLSFLWTGRAAPHYAALYSAALLAFFGLLRLAAHLLDLMIGALT